MTVSLALSSLLAILALVGRWFILEKMGEKGWKALIPFYGEYLIFKHAWNTKMYWASLALACIGGLGYLACVGLMATGSPAIAVTASLVSLVASIAALVIDVRCIYELCKHFGHGIGYTIGMLLFDPVFALVLGLGKDEFAEA